MPYIPNEIKADLIKNLTPQNPGELNFLITHLLQRYLNVKGLSYSVICEISGALGNANDEFYARVARPYEEEKMKSNGDVYETNFVHGPQHDN